MRSSPLAVAFVVACGVVSALQVGKATIALPALRDDLGLGLAESSWIMSVFPVLGVVLGLPVGVMVHSWGDRRLLAIGMACIVAGSGLGAFAPALSWLLATRLLEGLGFILAFVAAPSVLRRLVSPARLEMTLAAWSGAMPLGIGVALLTGPAWPSWQSLWLANGATALICFLGVLALVSSAGQATSRQSWRDVAAATRRTFAARRPTYLALAFACYTLQYFAVMSFLPVLLLERIGISIAVAGAISALVAVVNVGGNLAAGALLTRGVRPETLMVVVSLAMGALGAAAFVPATPESAVVAVCILFSAIGGLLPATMIACVPRYAPSPELAPVSMGLLMQGSNLGQVIAPATVGVAVAAGGWGMAAAPVGLAAVCGAVLGGLLAANPAARLARI